jgi:hypothetical protein
MSDDEKIAEYDFIAKSLKDFHDKGGIENLCKTVEHVRAVGMLYQDFDIKNESLLKDLLTASLDLTKQPSIYNSDRPWWFIMEVFDIVFHQVRLEKYPAICADLYFKLSKEVLDNKFHKFFERGSEIQSYRMCIYFILRARHWFTNRKEEFLLLFPRLEPLIAEQPDHLKKPWINRYQELA